MGKGKSPKSIPATMADVNKAHHDGMNFGIEFGLNVVLYVLKDKHDAKDEEIMQFRDEFMYVIDSIAKKYLTYSDVKRALKKEYDLTVELIDNGKD